MASRRVHPLTMQPRTRAPYPRLGWLVSPIMGCRERVGEAATGFLQHLDEFGQQSSAHGIRYLLDRRLPWWHRAAWLLAMAVALLGFSVIAKQSYHDLQRSPIITYDSNPTSVWDVPFPAVSVCGPWIAPRGTSDRISTLTAKRTSEEEKLDYEAARLLCGLVSREQPYAFRNYSHVWDLFARMSDIKISSLHHQFLGVFPHKHGYCVTANMHERGILTPEASWAEVLVHKGKRLFTDEDAPYLNNYLWIEIHHNTSERDESCERPNEETKYQVHVHDPGDYPGNNRDGEITVKMGSFVNLEWFVKDAVEPLDEVSSVPWHRRKCFYPHDAPRLRFFNHYTPGNCLTECRVAAELKLFGCVASEWRIHPVSQNVCDYHGYDMTKGVVSGEPCDCVQLCSHVVYGLQLSTEDDGRQYITDMRVSRKIHTFTKKIRSVVITDTGFVANCAGLLGLFLGVSVLSVFEVVYHLVVRASGANARIPVHDSTSSELQQLKQLCSTLQQELRDVKSSQHLHQKEISRYADGRFSQQDSPRINIPGSM